VIGIIEYGAGNVRSVCNALERLGADFFTAGNVDELRRARKLILPGVGEARSAMDSLARSGLLEWIPSVKVPFLGICIGMQILFDFSDERETACLGLVPGRVRRFRGEHVKIPHMGWNRVMARGACPLFQGIAEGEYFYFVHSYHAPIVQHTVAITHYEADFSAAVQRDNYFGVQFHVEKSGSAGAMVLKNFIELC
jgi:imidazole glycerol-phosphate synthase subunit HisH